MITVKNKNIANAVKGVAAIPVKPAPPKAVQIAPETMTSTVSPSEPITIEVKDIHGKVLGTLQAGYRTFSTGNKGYNISGNIPGIGADMLRVSGNVIIIGSKKQ